MNLRKLGGRSENLPHQLPVGTVLRGQYRIGGVLGQGGFGITYLGWDMTLQCRVAVKEYFPSGVVSRENTIRVTATTGDPIFRAGKERFLREAQTLARLQGVAEVVRVYSCFEENNTAYIVMEYVDGMDLGAYVKRLGRPLTAQETFSILRPIMEALEKVHEAGLVHRDVSPDNIMLLETGGAKLLDFGTARDVEVEAAGQENPRSTEAILKHGFAPIEQYQRRGSLGPWTDEYALGATAYYCMTLRVPPDAPERMTEKTALDWSGALGLDPWKTAVLNKAMSLVAGERYPTIRAMSEELFRQGPVPRTTAAKKQEQHEKKKGSPWKGILIAAAVLAVLAVAVLAGSRLLPDREPEAALGNNGLKDPGTEPREPETVATLSETDQRYQEILDVCEDYEEAEDYLGAVNYIRSQIGTMPDDRLDVLLEEYLLLYEESILDEAAIQAGLRQYARAIRILDEARAEEDREIFYDQAVEYRIEFGQFNNSALAAGKFNTILVNPNGTVTVVGDNGYGELAAGSWTDIVAVSAGDRHLVGLRSNGSLVTVGSNDVHQMEVTGWRDIIAISAGDTHTVGLRSDGTVVAAGFNSMNQCDMDLLMQKAGEKRIVSVAAGYGHTLALLEDGTVIAVGNAEYGECSVSGWTDIAAIYAGSEISVGLKTDGTVVAAGLNVDKWNLHSWTEVANMACGDYYLVAVKTDGTALAAGTDDYNYSEQGQRQVGSWTELVYIAAGNDHTVGIKADGTVVAVGSNQFGQCSCAGMFIGGRLE